MYVQGFEGNVILMTIDIRNLSREMESIKNKMELLQQKSKINEMREILDRFSSGNVRRKCQ